mgnify:CR=1 FL=1
MTQLLTSGYPTLCINNTTTTSSNNVTTTTTAIEIGKSSQVIPNRNALVVGRQVSSCDIRITHKSLSRQHALLYYYYYHHHDEASRQGFCRINSAAPAVGRLSLSNLRVMPPPCHQPHLIPPMICYFPWNAATSPPRLLCLPLQSTPLSGPSIVQLQFVILQNNDVSPRPTVLD